MTSAEQGGGRGSCTGLPVLLQARKADKMCCLIFASEGEKAGGGILGWVEGISKGGQGVGSRTGTWHLGQIHGPFSRWLRPNGAAAILSRVIVIPCPAVAQQDPLTCSEYSASQLACLFQCKLGLCCQLLILIVQVVQLYLS